MSMAEHPLKLILDTSIYIPFINQGIAHPVLDLPRRQPLLYMSAVVVEELYAGALDAPSEKLIYTLFDAFASLGRLITPDAADWQKTGKVVAKLGQKYGFERQFLSRITHDILIALTARRIGAMVVTGNTRDFIRIREFVDFKMHGR